MKTASTYPACAARLLDHTVEVPTGWVPNHPVVAGWLVRCTATGRDLGYVWPFGGAFGWRTPDGSSFGDRQTQRAAVQTLRDIQTQGTWRTPVVVVPDAAVAERVLRPEVVPAAPTTPKPKPEPKPVTFSGSIAWPELNVADLTGKIAAALKKQQ